MKNKIINSLQDLPKLLENPPETEGGGASGDKNMLEIMRLLREIHAAVCGKDEPKEEEKKRNVIPGHILRLMAEDRPYSPLEIYQRLTAEGRNFASTSISTAMTKLAQDSKILRLQKSLFQRLPQPKEGE